MRRLLARIALATAVFASLASCSSTSLTVADPIATDAGTDAPDPCAATAGVAGFCVVINPAPAHPPYGDPTATSLDLDGQGFVTVALYNVDPVANPDAAPVATLRYPPADQVGKTINVDTELATTLVGTVATPGSYWVVAIFQDNPVARSGATTTLPGDFLLTPSVDANEKLVFPSFNLSVGATAKLPITLQPYHEVDVTISPDPTVVVAAKANPTIHGNGPALLALYDGDVATGSPVLSESTSTGCIDLKLQTATPPANAIGKFGAYVSGEHRALVALFDYTSTPFPGKGTLLTPFLDPTKAPKIFVDPTLWISQGQVTIDLGATMYMPTDMPVDTFSCPATVTAGDPKIRPRAGQ
jgi:hypothetical protein